MPNITGARLARLALEEAGVRHAFGIPGVHTTELYDEFAISSLITPHLVCHEAGGGFMADAVSRLGGSLGCLAVVPAAGLTQAMSALAEAYLDGIPMLAITAGLNTANGKVHLLHEMDQQALTATVTKGFFSAKSHDEIAPAIYEAARTACSGVPGPVLVEIPQTLMVSAANAATPPAFTPSPLPPPPSAEQLDAALAAIAEMKRPGICVGWGARGAREELIALADFLQAPVSTSLQGLSSFPADHPLHTSFMFGHAAVPAGERAFENCDGLIAVGHRFGEVGTASWSMNPPENMVHIDIDPSSIGANYPARQGLVGDAKVVLKSLLDALQSSAKPRKNAKQLQKLIQTAKSDYRKEWHKHDSGERENPVAFYDALDKALAKDGIVVCDDGNHTFLTAELMPMSAQRRFVSPTDFNCMGYGVPGTIAASMCNPGNQVVGIIGDGAFHMTSNELLTAVAEETPVVIFVFNDGELSQISQAQEIPYNRKTCTVLPSADFSQIAAAYGASFVCLRDNNDVVDGVERALEMAKTGRPVLVDVQVDYSKRTRFTKGAVKTQLSRMPNKTKARIVGRALWRRVAPTE